MLDHPAAPSFASGSNIAIYWSFLLSEASVLYQWTCLACGTDWVVSCMCVKKKKTQLSNPLQTLHSGWSCISCFCDSSMSLSFIAFYLGFSLSLCFCWAALPLLPALAHPVSSPAPDQNQDSQFDPIPVLISKTPSQGKEQEQGSWSHASWPCSNNHPKKQQNLI